MINTATLGYKLKDQGNNQSMSNFGLFFIFAKICLILACGRQIDRKTFLCIFSLVFSSFSS